MQRALLASLIVGVLCSVIGTFVVLRAMAFLGDALAHAILPGVAIAYLLGANLLLGALVAADPRRRRHRRCSRAAAASRRTPPSASSSPRRSRSASCS